MRGYKKSSKDLTVILLRKSGLVCALVGLGTYKRYTIKQSISIQWPLSITHTGTLVYTAWLGAQIEAFLKKYHATHTFVTIVADEAIMMHGYATTLSASAHAYLNRNLTMPHHRLDTLYVCPYEDKFLHWWARCHYGLLLQLQLIAYRYQFNLISIVPSFPIILAVYKEVHGATFHPVKVAADLVRTHYDLATSFDQSTIHHLAEGIYGKNIDLHATVLIIGAALYEGL